MRLFIASDLPDRVKQILGASASRLRRELPQASWGRPETYHVTYAFLGDQEESVVSGLGDSLAGSLAATPAFDAEIGGAGFFPDPRRPRIAWVGLAPAESFARVAVDARSAVQAAGLSMDGKPFAPHMTIARVKAPWRREDVERFTAAYAMPPARVRIDTVTLYASRLGSGGAVHTPLRVISLAGDLPLNRSG